MTYRETMFQARVIRKIRKMFPECIILKNDPNYLQGVPDILILWGNRWAALEVKTGPMSEQQVNQDYYVSKMNEMSFAAFIWPGNEKEILDELQFALRAYRSARLSQRQQVSLD